MSLINELKEKSNKAYDIRQEVIEEIKEYFDEYLDSDRFEKFLRKNIGNEEIKNRETFLIVSFWEYHNGCLDTYFTCGGKKWNNPENQYNYGSRIYKGVYLRDIQNEICNYLEKRLIQKMKDLGFSYLRQDKKESRFEYFNSLYYFGW